MDIVTQRALEMYDQYRVGHYSYHDKREKYDPMLMDFLHSISKDKTIYDIGCGSGFWMETYHRLGFKKDNIYGVDLSTMPTMPVTVFAPSIFSPVARLVKIDRWLPG